MKIALKSNITLYVMDASDKSYFLTEYDPYNEIMGYDEPASWDNSGYTYVLPRNKTCFDDLYQCQEITAYVEKIDERNKRVFVSQVHWLYMRNIIERRLCLHVKILKRYPGKLTVAQLTMPGQRIDKMVLKALAEEMGEKIYIKDIR